MWKNSIPLSGAPTLLCVFSAVLLLFSAVLLPLSAGAPSLPGAPSLSGALVCADLPPLTLVALPLAVTPLTLSHTACVPLFVSLSLRVCVTVCVLGGVASHPFTLHITSLHTRASVCSASAPSATAGGGSS